MDIGAVLDGALMTSLLLIVLIIIVWFVLPKILDLIPWLPLSTMVAGTLIMTAVAIVSWALVVALLQMTEPLLWFVLGGSTAGMLGGLVFGSVRRWYR